MQQNNETNGSYQEDYNINSDENLSGTEHLTEPMNEGETDKLQQELDESKDKYIRLAAEFDNFRKRTAKERVELFQTAGREVIADLLNVVDDADRAQQQLQAQDNSPAKEGVILVFNKLRNILQSKGLKAMETIGTAFDPELHEAITEIPAPKADQSGKVIDEVQKGYYLNDKIIRHAKVVVGK